MADGKKPGDDLTTRITRLSPNKQKLLMRRLKKGAQGAGAVEITRQRREPGALSLSYSQERLWFLDQLQPGTSAYNIRATVRLRGRLNVPVLERAFSEIARRHETLRTIFSQTDGKPVQVIAPPEQVLLPLVDLSLLQEGRREQEARRLASEEAHRPFDLASGPLFRVGLLRLDEQEHYLLLTMHHIISDGWSVTVLVREAALLYEAFVKNNPYPLADLQIQYADYALWQRSFLTGETLANHLAYWKEQLGGDLPALELPADRPRPAIQTSRGARLSIVLSRGLTESIKRLSRDNGATLFMTLLAAFKSLLFRYTGHDDIIVGTPIASRNRAEVENLIGFFVNTLVMRTSLASDPSFEQLLDRVKQVALGAYAHQDVPFEKLLEEIHPEREMSRTPLFQVWFNLFNVGTSNVKVELPGLTIEDLSSEDLSPASEVETKFDLSLLAAETDENIQISLDYSTDIFESETIERMLRHFETLLKAIVTNPQRPISMLSLLSEDEERELRGKKNSVAPTNRFDEFGKEEIEQSLVSRFEAQADKYPRNIAVRTRSFEWTYEELNGRANRAARLIVSRCGAGEERIALLFKPDAPMIAGILGALKSGKSYVPLDPSYPEERLAAILEDSQASAVLTGEENLSFATELAKGRIPVLVLNGNDSGFPVDNIGLDISPDGLAYILYTSGSTGLPKGVAQSHRNVLHFIRNYTNNLHIGPEDRLSLLSPYTFDAAIMDIFGALLNGSTLFPIDLKEEGIFTLAERLIEYGITIYHSTPTVYRYFISSLTVNDCFPSIRLVVLGGEEVFKKDFELYKEWFSPECIFINGLGPTESTVTLQCFLAKQSQVSRNSVPVGFPVEDTEVMLLDNNRNESPIFGEIAIRSDHVALGYWRNQQLTNEVFLPDPEGGKRRIYCTGDMGRRLPDGSIEYFGRKDFQVKIRGFRVELSEVEAAIKEHPSVRESAVVASTGDGLERSLLAFVVPSDQTLSAPQLRNWLADRLPDFMIPSRILLLDSLPLTPSGKLDRRALLIHHHAPDTQPASSMPAGPIEQAVADVWKDLLGLTSVSAHANFFELGGHSLLATQIISRLRDQFKVDLELKAIFQSPTVWGLARKIQTALGQQRGEQRPLIRRVERGGRLALSFAQQRLWFFDQLEPGSAVYNIPAAVRLDGEIDVRALEQSVRRIIQRQEVLRTRFEGDAADPVAVIMDEVRFELPVIDLSQLEEGKREAEAKRVVVEQSQRGFDLREGNLIRVWLVKVGEREHIFAMTMHHIISDGWSLGVLIRELGSYYERIKRGKQEEIEELEVGYVDYAEWQREWLAGEELDRQMGYWREALKGAPAVLELPTDRRRPAIQRYRGRREEVRLTEGLSRAIREMSAKRQVTRYMLMLAAFNVVLSRYSGQEDIVIGTPIANRSSREVEGLIGYFANTLVIRSRVEGKKRFEEYLEEVKEACIGAYVYQEVPFEKLVEEMQPARDLSHSPLFQVVFELQDASIENLQGPGLTISRFNVDKETAKFDLDLLMIDEGDSFVASFEYSTDLFDQTTIKRMAGHFVRLLESIVADSTLAVEDLSILTEAEREIITQWNRTETDYPLDICVHELFEQQVARTPNALAVSYEGERLTYEQLNAQANRMARGLIERGVGPEVVVALLANRNIEMLVAILGIFKAGGAYVPLDPKHPPSRLASMLGQSKSRLILTTDGCLSVAKETLEIESGEQAPQVLVYERLLEASHADTNIGKRSDPANLAYVIFTSGSTGRPKGAMVEQAGMVNHILSKIDDLRITGTDVLAQNASQCFDVSVWQFLAALLVGGRTEILNDEDASDPLQLLRAIDRTGITILEIVPSQLRSMLEQISFSASARPDLSTLRWIFVMGEVLPPELCRQWQEIYPGAVMINAYGVTEVSDDVSHHHLYETPADDTVRLPVGGPLPNMRLYVLDKAFSFAPIGIPGELYIGGICVGRGYLDDPERTASVFVPDPFSAQPGARLYKTGDLVRFLPDGNLDFLGRADYQVKVRGFRVELGEIEAVLDRHPAIWQSVVVVREDVPGEKRLLAYIVNKADQLLTIGDLRAYLKDSLPDYMIPSAFITLDSLPLNANGKVDRHALPLPESARPDLEKEYIAPTSPAEKRLATIWEQVLRVDSVGIHDNFFELGGDSIMMIQVISRASQAGLRLTLKQAFQYQTIAELAEHAASTPDVKAEQGIVTGRLPLTPAQSWLVEQDLKHPHHFNQALMFEVQQPVDTALMMSVVRQLLIQHDALRLRFGGETRWEPFIDAVGEATPFAVLDLSEAPRQRQSILIEAAASQLQTSLNLAGGPLMRVALFDLGAGLPARLLIVIHHMAVDGVSWRILIEDLQTTYRQLSQGEQVRLPAKTTSFKEWAERLSEYSRSDDLRQEANYWVSKGRKQARGLPKDFPEGENTVATLRTFTTSLTAAETQTLLRVVPTAFNTQINDVLLTALAQSFEQWTLRRRLLIDLEGHGREDIFDDIDLSRTVGWFTSIYPVLLELGGASSPVECLKAIKEQLRNIPNRGVGYGILCYLSQDADIANGLRMQPQAEVIFNYLGQFNNPANNNEQATPALHMGPAPEDSGPPRSPLQKRRYLFEVSVMVAGEQLHLMWKYSESIHRRATVERLAGGFVEALRLLIEQSTEAARFVSTDFPEIELNQEKIDKALAELDLG